MRYLTPHANFSSVVKRQILPWDIEHITYPYPRAPLHQSFRDDRKFVNLDFFSSPAMLLRFFLFLPLPNRVKPACPSQTAPGTLTDLEEVVPDFPNRTPPETADPLGGTGEGERDRDAPDFLNRTPPPPVGPTFGGAVELDFDRGTFDCDAFAAAALEVAVAAAALAVSLTSEEAVDFSNRPPPPPAGPPIGGTGEDDRDRGRFVGAGAGAAFAVALSRDEAVDLA